MRAGQQPLHDQSAQSDSKSGATVCQIGSIITQMQIDVLELSVRLAECLQVVKSGRQVLITERGQVIAQLIPSAQSLEDQIQALIDAGIAEWTGKPLPPVVDPPIVRGSRTVADLLIEDRE